MRELKFRAWNGEVMSSNAQSIHEIADKEYAFKTDDLIFMQYTGLKDKNGNEIYEGDIIKTPQDIFKLEYGEKDYCIIFYLSSVEKFMSLPYLVGLKDFEVIGNIYESPDLLNTNV